MLRPLMFAALLAGNAQAASAERIGPEIAYSINNQIFLINSNGSGNVRIHRAPGNAFIDSISLKSGGGQIAFVENWVLKFMSYDDGGARLGPIYALPGCYRQFSVQFAPDGQSVIYGETCAGVRSFKRVAVPTADNPNPVPEILVDGLEYAYLGGFDGAGQSFVYSVETASGYELRRYYLDGRTPNDVALLSIPPGSMIRNSALSHDGTKVLYSDWSGTFTTANTGYIDEYDVSTGAVRDNVQRALLGDYGPSDAAILYAEKQGKTTYLRYLDSSGQPHTITKSGAWEAFHDIDWGD